MGRKRKQDALTPAQRTLRYRLKRKKAGAKDVLLRLSPTQVERIEALADQAGVPFATALMAVIAERLGE